MVIMFIYFILEAACRILGSVFIEFIMLAMLNQNYNEAYFYAGFLILSLVLSSIFFHNSYLKSSALSNKMRASIMYIIYKRVSGLSQYIIRNTDTGKIINMISNDFNSI
jgi:hypothetical protein